MGQIGLNGQALALHNINTNGFIYRTGDSTFTRATTGATTANNLPIFSDVPGSSTAAGTPGMMAFDANGTFMYVCTGANLWARVALQAY